MTGDHHGQAAGMASLLVRAVDGILGTHRSSEKDQVNWHLVGGLPYRMRWFGRRALEKDLPSRHLASVLPHSPATGVMQSCAP
jgi:hypothetical protein